MSLHNDEDDWLIESMIEAGAADDSAFLSASLTATLSKEKRTEALSE